MSPYGTNMGRKHSSISQIVTLFNALRFFYDKMPVKGPPIDYKASSVYLEKLKHFHGTGMHCYYVADLRQMKIVEVGGSVLKMVGFSPEKIAGRNFVFGLKFFALDEMIDILQGMIDYHQYVYEQPVDKRLLIKGAVVLKVKNGKGGYFTGLLQAAPLALDEKGQVALMYSSITDISHFRLSEDLVKMDIIDESDEEDVKVINILNKKKYVVLELTKAELRVLEFLKYGKSTKEIADILSLSEHTINNHRRNMMEKANVRNTAELISKALQL